MDTTQRWWSGRLLELGEDECWELLQAVSVARIAWHEPGGPVVIPVNIDVHNGAIWVRTKPHSALASHVDGGEIAIQVDDADEFTHSGWSVLARGRAHTVTHDLQLQDLGQPSPWAEGARPLLIRLVPTYLTGRRLLAS